MSFIRRTKTVNNLRQSLHQRVNSSHLHHHHSQSDIQQTTSITLTRNLATTFTTTVLRYRSSARFEHSVRLFETTVVKKGVAHEGCDDARFESATVIIMNEVGWSERIDSCKSLIYCRI
jgi:hypothetical protein